MIHWLTHWNWAQTAIAWNTIPVNILIALNNVYICVPYVIAFMYSIILYKSTHFVRVIFAGRFSKFSTIVMFLFLFIHMAV
jgi:hypothetical protein